MFPRVPSQSPPDVDSSATPVAWTSAVDGRDRVIALALFAASLCLYASLQQGKFWSDGPAIHLLAEVGSWSYHKPLILPAFHLVHAVRGVFGGGSDVTPSLLWIAHLATGGSVALVYLLAREVARDRAVALCVVLLFALAPCVLFYATTIEVHTLQLLVAAAATLWTVRARARGTLVASALPWAVAIALLGATHPTGWFWAPAVAVPVLVRWRTRGRPRHVVASVLLLVAVVVAIWFLVPRFNPNTPGNALESFDDARAWWKIGVELSLALLVLWIPLAAGVLCLARLPRGGDPLRLRAAGALLAVTFVVLLLQLAVNERGAYVFSLLPLVAAVAALALARSRVLLVVCFALVPVQAGVAERMRGDWNHGAAPEWVEDLDAELGRSAVVLCHSAFEQRMIRRQSRALGQTLTTAVMRVPPEEFVLLTAPTPPEVDPVPTEKQVLLRWFHTTFHSGHDRPVRLVVTEALLREGTAEQRAWLARLAATLGEPVPGRNPAYRIYPAQSDERP